MRSRRMFYLLLVAILLVAVILTRRPRQEPAPELVAAVVAVQDIGPYSFISAGQTGLSSAKVSASVAHQYFTQPDQLAGLMTTRLVKAGQLVSREDAQPVEDVRYVENMQLEVVSFPAVFSEMVAGQVRPGHRINIYGYRTGVAQGDPGDMVLVAGGVWVVDVRTASGERVESAEGANGSSEGRLFTVSGATGIAQPASVVTVAANPGVVQSIILNLGSKGYSAWVTLAPAQEHIQSIAVVPTATPAPARTPTPAPPPPLADLTGLTGAVHMSFRRDGPKTDTFPNTASTVWAVAELQYSPAKPAQVRLVVHDDNLEIVFDSDFVLPGPGVQSYLIRPRAGGGFSANSQFTTVLYAGSKSFEVDWRTAGDARLPATGSDAETETAK